MEGSIQGLTPLSHTLAPPRAYIARLAARMVIVVLLASAPAIGLLGLQAFTAYRTAERHAQEIGLSAARIAAADYENVLHTAEALLAVVASLPTVSTTAPDACSQSLESVYRAYHSSQNAVRLSALFLAAPGGRVACSSEPLSGDLDFGDRAYFRSAIETKKFVAGRHVFGRHSAELLIPAALAKLSSDGAVIGVVVTGLKLDWLSGAAALGLDAHSVISVLDEDGVIVARSEDHQLWVGRTHPWSSDMAGLLDKQGEGFVTRAGADGLLRLFTIKKVSIGPNAFYVMIGYDAGAVFSPARREFITGVALIGVAILLLLGSALYGSRRYITEPIARLTGAALRMAQGDLSSRVGEHGRFEFAALGTAFDKMASSLQSRAAELAESNELLSAIIDSSPFAIFVVDTDARVLSWNAAAERIYGWAEVELIGKTFPAVPEDQRDAFHDLRAEAIDEEARQTYEAERVRKDGKRIRLRCSSAPVHARDGSLRGTLYIAEDITESRLLQEQLVQAQKMEAIGQLTGGVAHDFNNLLQVILGCSELLTSRFESSGEQQEIASMILEAANRGASLTRQLLAFSRRQPLDPQSLDANTVVRDLAPMLRRTLGENIELREQLSENLHPCLVDRGQLETALVNLTVNARDAMADGGRLVIETANVHLDEEYASRRTEVAPGDYVMISVSDTGAGMSRDVLSRIFEPFFTTKPIGRGTGLGLSMVFGFVKQSKGHVAAYSEPGHGTTFRLYLPRAQKSDAEERGPDAASVPRDLNLRVLYVEDDPDVRKAGLIQLASLGCQVIEAQGAEDAFNTLRRFGPFDLLFTDVILGSGLNGWELAQRAQEIQPNLRVLFASGYNEAVVIRDGLLKPGVILLTKPFSRTALALKLAEAASR